MSPPVLGIVDFRLIIIDTEWLYNFSNAVYSPEISIFNYGLLIEMSSKQGVRLTSKNERSVFTKVKVQKSEKLSHSRKVSSSY